MSPVIKVENLSKRYSLFFPHSSFCVLNCISSPLSAPCSLRGFEPPRLGVINRDMLYKDLQSRWAKFRGKEDPNVPGES